LASGWTCWPIFTIHGVGVARGARPRRARAPAPGGGACGR
jgi:hypothetical protein